jgi:hypothetical protein
VTVCVVLGLSAVVLAAPTVNVEFDPDDPEKIIVSGETTAGDEVTILVLAPYEGEIEENDIMYIDQVTSDDGTYSFEFYMRDGAGPDEYHIWVGGTNVDDPNKGTFEYDPAGEPGDVIYGDVNGRDGVTLADAVVIVDIFLGNVTPTPEQIIAADVNGRDGVTLADAVLIVDYFLGNITIFPVEVVE